MAGRGDLGVTRVEILRMNKANLPLAGQWDRRARRVSGRAWEAGSWRPGRQEAEGREG
jgi:hypothetical protein